MRVIHLLLMVFGMCLVAANQGLGSGLQIINGNDADENEYPFMVRLQKNGGHYCGASLITSRIALTAAHCVTDSWDNDKPYPPKDFTLVVGDHAESTTGEHEQVLEVSQVIVHEGYDGQELVNDIALLVLKERIEIKKGVIETIPLAQNDVLYEEGRSVTVIGWGSTDRYGNSPDVLQELEFEVADQSACKDFFGKNLPGQVCIIDPERKATDYYGDSGGPLFVKSEGSFTQIGLVSWGPPVHESGLTYFSVFTDVFQHHRWIEEAVSSVEDDDEGGDEDDDKEDEDDHDGGDDDGKDDSDDDEEDNGLELEFGGAKLSIALSAIRRKWNFEEYWD